MLLLLGVLNSSRIELARSVVDDWALEGSIVFCDKRPKLICGADGGRGVLPLDVGIDVNLPTSARRDALDRSTADAALDKSSMSHEELCGMSSRKDVLEARAARIF